MSTLGRPPVAYSKREFGAEVMRKLKEKGFGRKELARRIGMDSGTFGQVLRGGRSCPPPFLKAIIETLDFSEQDRERFLGSVRKPKSARPIPVPLHFPSEAREHLDRGQIHLLHAEYDQAVRYFERVFYSLEWTTATDIRADAATGLAWVHFEKGECRDSENRIADAIGLVERHFGQSLTQILVSFERGSHSAISSPTGDYAVLILWSALHIRSKLLTEQIVYSDILEKLQPPPPPNSVLIRQARETFNQIQVIDDYLQTPLSIGHNQRWLAVFLAETTSRKRQPDRCLSMSAESFGDTGLKLENAYLTRDKGVAYWRLDRISPAREHLEAGASALGSCGDLRGMGPGFVCTEQTRDPDR